MSRIKECYTSRWGEDGVIMNADFSQLEIIILAHITKDKQLTHDLINGVDLHRVRAAEWLKKPEASVTESERRTAKALSFLLQYGGGAPTMAKKHGISPSAAQDFINSYYDRYPSVKSWQDAMIGKMKAESFATTNKSPKGYPCRQSTWQSETGRWYVFTEGDAPDFLVARGRHTAFKPTEIKNYPIQGTATGDIVPMMLGVIYRWLLNSPYANKAKLINTVHDSIMLDIKKDIVYDVGNRLKKLMEDTPKIYLDTFGVEIKVPMKVDVTFGKSWAEQTNTIGV